MKEKFFGFYPPEEKEIVDTWQKSIIAFDANTLLNLYRYSKGTKDDFLSTIKEYSTRIWLPYQAAYEFHSNRISVIKSQEASYFEISQNLDSAFSKIENDLNQYKRHPIINIKNILDDVSRKFDELKAELKKLSEKHPEHLNSDEILPEITKLFDAKVGDNYSESDLEKIFKEGEVRYEKKIPPGFSDLPNKKKEGDEKLYGDLIIWKQLIDKSKKEKKTIIFVTDDRKEDWWLKFKGKTIRPREELIKEFYDNTGYRILIYQADYFLKFAKQKLKSKIKDESIKEIKRVRIEDEEKYETLQKFVRNQMLSDATKIPSSSKSIQEIINQLNSYPQPGKYIKDIAQSLSDLPKSTQAMMDSINQLQHIPTPPTNIADLARQIGNIPSLPKYTVDYFNNYSNIPQPPPPPPPPMPRPKIESKKVQNKRNKN